MKFNPFRKPQAPIKPIEPNKTYLKPKILDSLCSNDSKYNLKELFDKYKDIKGAYLYINTDYDYDSNYCVVEIRIDEDVPNQSFDYYNKIYLKALPKYQEKLKKYEADIELWTKLHKEWKKNENKKAKEERRKQFEKLKKEFE